MNKIKTKLNFFVDCMGAVPLVPVFELIEKDLYKRTLSG